MFDFFKIYYPLSKEFPINSGFGVRDNRYHNGVDIGAPSGTEVIAISDGEVVRADMSDYNGYGNLILLKHKALGQTIYSAYAHLTSMDVNVGDIVEKGDVIGISGGDQGKPLGAGNSTGPHLHFELRKKESPDPNNPSDFYNPEYYLRVATVGELKLKDKLKKKVKTTIEKGKEKTKEISDKTKQKVDEISENLKEIKDEFVIRLKDPKFREEMARKVGVPEERLEDELNTLDSLKIMVATGVEVLKDEAPETWKKANNIWNKIKDVGAGIRDSHTVSFFRDMLGDVRKEYEASDKSMWEQEEKIKKIIQKIL